MQGDQPTLEKHFAFRLLRREPNQLQQKLEARFGHPFLVRYIVHGDMLQCIFVQRWDTKHLMRIYEREFDDLSGSSPWHRLEQRLMHRMENELFDNQT